MGKIGIEAKRIIERNHDLAEGELKGVLIISDEIIMVFGAKSIIDYITSLNGESKVISGEFKYLPSDGFFGEVFDASMYGLQGHGGGKVILVNESKRIPSGS